MDDRDYPSLTGYEVLGELGRGGMGVVYKAREKALNRLVALKVILDGDHAGPEELERFSQEAKAAAQLQHPHVVRVYQVGKQDGRPYLSMEYVEGGSLAQKLQGKPLPPRQAAELVETLARAIQFTHDQKVVHRDLKPANVLLAPGNGPGAIQLGSTNGEAESFEPKITDFGLGKCLDRNLGLTSTGKLLGTPPYMAPEQARGESGADWYLVDVYALGATLYELLTGRPPFQSATLLETLEQVTSDQEPVPPRRLQPKVPRDLETICLKCLRKEPAKRYASAEALAEDLRRFLEGRPIQARRVGPVRHAWRWCKRKPAVAGLLTALVLVFLVGFMGVVWQWRRAEASAGRERCRAREVDAARNLEAIQRRFSLPQPGWTWAALDLLADAAKREAPAPDVLDLRKLSVSCMARVDLRRIGEVAKDSNAFCLAFSPDGNFLAIGEYKGLFSCSIFLIDANQKQLLRSFPVPTGVRIRDTGVRALVFSPDSRKLVAGMRNGYLHLLDTSPSGNVEPISWQAHDEEVTGLAFRPDGRTVISCSRDKFVKAWDITNQPTEPVAFRLLETIVQDIALSPDGSRLVCGTIAGLHFLDPITLKVLAPQLRDNHRVVCYSPKSGIIAAAFREGDIVLLREHAGEVEVSRTLRDPELDVAHSIEISHLEFSPDGSLLVSGSTDQTVKFWEVATGRLLVTIPAGGAANVYPAFHPSGSYLAVTGNRETVLWEVGGLKEQTTVGHHSYPVEGIAFTPDGMTLGCIARDYRGHHHEYRGEASLWDAESGVLRDRHAFSGLHTNLVGSGLASLAFHPDGKTLAFGAGDSEVHLWDLVEKKPKVTVKGLTSCLSFAADGRRLWGVFTPGMIDRPPQSLLDADQLVALEWPGLSVSPQWDNRRAKLFQGSSGLTSVSVGRKWMLVGSRDGTARLFRAQAARSPEKQWPRAEGPVQCVAISQDESLGAWGSQNGDVQVVELPGGEPLVLPKAHPDEVSALAFHPTGQILATGGRDRVIRLWRREGQTFKEFVTLPAGSAVTSLCFSPDGKNLAVVIQGERAVRVWHLERLKARLEALGLGWDP